MDKRIDRMLDQYPAAVFKNRKDHLLEKTEEKTGPITANTRTIPGIITNRGCCYAGCKGVVLGPLRDAVVITHGPIGCGYYTWGTRRNKGRSEKGEKNFLNYCFSTDLQEGDIVFGGEKKLKAAIEDAVRIFAPSTVFVCSTCPVGLIGDDIHAVARWATETFGIKVVSFSCEGYKGVSQSGGHHIANNGLITHVIGTGDKAVGRYAINLLGEYNIGGDGFEIERLLKAIGYDVVSVMTGNGTVEDLSSRIAVRSAPAAGSSSPSTSAGAPDPSGLRTSIATAMRLTDSVTTTTPRHAWRATRAPPAGATVRPLTADFHTRHASSSATATP